MCILSFLLEREREREGERERERGRREREKEREMTYNPISPLIVSRYLPVHQ